MSESPSVEHQREHPAFDFLLDSPAGQQARTVTAKSGIQIEVQPYRHHINLRGNPDDEEFIATCEQALNQSIPKIANHLSRDTHTIFWLGPNEWLLITEQSNVADRLTSALADQHSSVTDLSGGQILLQLTGQHACDLLAKGCTLDFHPRHFQPGHCAQSGLAKTSMLIGLLDDAPTFQIVIRRSFADYAARWLDHAGHEYGLRWAE